MASRANWLRLIKETFGAVDQDGVLDLYRVDIKEAGRELLRESRDAIEQEQRPWKRRLKVANAVLYGLSRRLPADRRLVFLISFCLVVLAALSPPHEDPSGEGVTGLLSFFTLVAVFFVMAGLLALELVDKLRFRNELEMARDIQADLVQGEPPAIPGYELCATNQIANTVGGDIYEFAPLPDGRLAILFGDASGHGMAAGLVMAVVNAAFRTQLEHDASPLAMMDVLNRILCRSGACKTQGVRSFFSGVVLVLEPGGAFSAVVAGHPPVLRVGPDGTILQRIGQGSLPLGIRERVHFSEESGSLAPAETLLFLSDGLPEARSDVYGDFGYERVDEIIMANAGVSPRGLVLALTSALNSFLQGRRPEDDVSIAAIKRNS